MDTFVSDYQPVFDRIKITPKVGFKDVISLNFGKNLCHFRLMSFFMSFLDLNLN